jgi:hypothetical protein
MAGGALPLDYDTSESILKVLRRAGKKARADANKFARKPEYEIGNALLADA